MELVKLTHENIDREHICCAISNGTQGRRPERCFSDLSYSDRGGGTEPTDMLRMNLKSNKGR